jgi:hypothetical protein
MVASKTLYTLLKVPEILFNLMTDGQADLVYEGAVNLFATVTSVLWHNRSWHSGRSTRKKTLNGMGSQLDIPKYERDFLGR